MGERTVLEISGNDRVSFLQGLITNDVPTDLNSIAYAALLTPQGKFVSDFFVIAQSDILWIDVATSHAPQLAQRLTMYRLRADVQISEASVVVSRGINTAPKGALMDPRSDAMGWRSYGATDVSEDVDWTAQRVGAGIPKTGVELTPDTYILEAGFEALNGVNFKKGCFVGQEIVARMKHKTELRKGIVQVTISGNAEPGDEIKKDGKAVGTLYSVSNNKGLAYLRFDRADGEMTAGEATLTRILD